jgi:hypothetical protein
MSVTEMILYVAVRNVVNNSVCVCDGDVEADCLHCECVIAIETVNDMRESREERHMEVLKTIAETNPFPGL